MSERQVTIERQRRELPQPFVVVATQNPLEFQGTFPLPESQLDRFLMSLELGYPPKEDERNLLLSGGAEDLLADLHPVLGREEFLDLQAQVTTVKVADKLTDYMLAIAHATRNSERFSLGVSTRAAQSLFRATQALAFCEGRSFAIPDDVQRLVLAVLAHRVVLPMSTGLGATRDALRQVLSEVPVPL